MRFLFAVVLVAVALGCGDDDDAAPDDASTDAGLHQTDDAAVPHDATVPHKDGGAADGGAREDASNTHDAADAAMCKHEPIFRHTEPFSTAVRVSLDQFCQRYACARDWHTALQPFEEDGGVPLYECYVTITGCGVDSLHRQYGFDSYLLNYDHESGELIGAAYTTDTDTWVCSTNQIHAGRDRPDCPSETAKVVSGDECFTGDEDAGR